jgi:ribosomal protein S25
MNNKKGHNKSQEAIYSSAVTVKDSYDNVTNETKKKSTITRQNLGNEMAILQIDGGDFEDSNSHEQASTFVRS